MHRNIFRSAIQSRILAYYRAENVVTCWSVCDSASKHFLLAKFLAGQLMSFTRRMVLDCTTLNGS